MLRAVPDESLHVTLCFLGWGREDDVEPVAAACGVLAAEPAPRLAVADGLWLPRRRPRVVAVRLEDSDQQLEHVQRALSEALAAGGWYEPERRPYLAHVTVARVGAGIGPRPPELPEPPRVEFEAPHVVLYRSRLSRSGARYEALARVDLAAPTAPQQKPPSTA
jgi:RNA 2',3'-cyclic 3'-phosphodiesterase